MQLRVGTRTSSLKLQQLHSKRYVYMQGPFNVFDLSNKYALTDYTPNICTAVVRTVSFEGEIDLKIHHTVIHRQYLQGIMMIGYETPVDVQDFKRSILARLKI